MSNPDELWRARELEDANRKLLATANIAGIGIFLALAALLATEGVSPRWPFLAVGSFAVGVLCVVGGHLLFPHNRWNVAGLIFLLLGAGAGIYKLDKAPSPPDARQAAAPAVDTAPAAVIQATQYAAIIDAGSSGSRLWIFKWSKEKGDPIVDKQLYLEDKDVPDNKKQKCPLTNMITNEQVTCDCLTRLLTQGQQTLAAAGVSATAKVPLWVKATGGVRKRKMEEQVEILEKTERCLTSAEHYSWQRAEAIGGSTEALYAWLAINYARKTLQPKRTLGIVEIGGESAQIAFEVPGAIAPNQRGSVVAVPLSSGNMYVYAHSDVLGKDAAIAALDGKTPRSVPIPDCGVADKIGRCETKIDKFICPHPDGKEPCSQRSPQFPPDGISFIGLSNFKHVVRNIKVDKPLLSAARDRARQMCGPDSEMIKLRDKYITVKGDYRQDVCLDILYMSRVATYAWGLTLPAVTAADDTDPEWPLGAMFMQIAQSTNKTAR